MHKARNFKNWVVEREYLRANGYPTGKFRLRGRYIDNNKYSPFYHGKAVANDSKVHPPVGEV